ncbi:MAG TPA: signal transduction protein, partial [Coleofasciculaceae cyanobacterium]
YSFSHLTFQEYFTALEVINRFDPQSPEKLFNRMTRKSWREVFLLAVGMIQPADELLLSMKRKIDELLASDNNLQQFLIWINQKSCLAEVPYKPVVVRTFYFAFPLEPDYLFAKLLALGYDFADVLALVSKLSKNPILTDFLKLVCELAKNITYNFWYAQDLARDLIYNLDHLNALEPELRSSVQQLKAQVPNPDQDLYRFGEWWTAKSKAWTWELIVLLFEPHNPGYNWQFSEQQKKLLTQYYDANKLLMDCLNSGCEVSPEVGQEIEETLLLTIAEIEKRRNKG